MSSTVAPSNTSPMFVYILSSMASLRVAALVNCSSPQCMRKNESLSWLKSPAKIMPDYVLR